MQRGPEITLFMLDFFFLSSKVLEIQIFIAQEKTVHPYHETDTEQVTLSKQGSDLFSSYLNCRLLYLSVVIVVTTQEPAKHLGAKRLLVRPQRGTVTAWRS